MTILGLIKNQQVRIKENSHGAYTKVVSLQNGSTPGVVRKFKVEPNTEYVFLVDGFKKPGTGHVFLYLVGGKKRHNLVPDNRVIYLSETPELKTVYFNTGSNKEIRVGVLFQHPKKNDRFYLRILKVKEATSCDAIYLQSLTAAEVEGPPELLENLDEGLTGMSDRELSKTSIDQESKKKHPVKKKPQNPVKEVKKEKTKEGSKPAKTKKKDRLLIKLKKAAKAEKLKSKAETKAEPPKPKIETLKPKPKAEPPKPKPKAEPPKPKPKAEPKQELPKQTEVVELVKPSKKQKKKPGKLIKEKAKIPVPKTSTPPKYPSVPQYVFVVTGYNWAKWVDKCVKSILKQERSNWICLLCDDHSTDRTWVRLQKYKNHPKLFLYRTPKNMGACYARYHGLHTIKHLLHDEDVLLLIGGDDYLASNKVLNIVDKEYRRGAQVTYGNWQDLTGRVHHLRPLPPHIIEGKLYRKHPWVTTAINTFKYYLFKDVPISEYLEPSGKWIKNCTDLAVMFPVMERAQRVRPIKQILYIYNSRYGHNTLSRFGIKDKGRLNKIIRNKPVYQK